MPSIFKFLENSSDNEPVIRTSSPISRVTRNRNTVTEKKELKEEQIENDISNIDKKDNKIEESILEKDFITEKDNDSILLEEKESVLEENKEIISQKKNDEDEDEDEDEEISNIDLNGMKKAFSDMHTNIVIAPSNNKEKFKRIRETIEVQKYNKNKKITNDILEEKLKKQPEKINNKEFLDETELAKSIDNSLKILDNKTKNNLEYNETKDKTDKINKINETDKAKEQKEKNSIIDNNNQIKQEEQENLELSEIVAITTTRPIEIAFDLECRYITENIVRPNLYIHNDDFNDLVTKNPDIKYLDISDCSMLDDFTPLLKLTNLEQLDISGCRNFKDLSLLSNMSKLKVLNLSMTGIESIDNLPFFQDLTVLSLKLLRIKDINILKKYEKLHDLVLWGCSSITNINAVSNLKELRLLDLDSCITIKNIEPIKNLVNLVYLNFNFLKIEDLSPIKNLINLETFTMEFSSLALTEENLSYFEDLVEMKFLGLRNRVIRNLHYFRNMTKISELELSGNVINNLAPLENMTEIQILNLSTNSNLIDISPLYKMEKLKKLHLNGLSSPKGGRIDMLVSDISVVKYLKELNVFESNFNKKLKNISPLQYCSKLEEFSVNSCLGIDDISPLRFCKGLKIISVENCMQIRDISFVKYLTKLQQINISKTSVDRLSMSNWTRLYDLWGLRDSSNNVLIHTMLMDSIKFRKKISKTIKKVVKEKK